MTRLFNWTIPENSMLTVDEGVEIAKISQAAIDDIWRRHKLSCPKKPHITIGVVKVIFEAIMEVKNSEAK